MSVDLRLYRESLSSGGLEAVQTLPGFFADLQPVVPNAPSDAGHHFESLAFDALVHGQAGWGSICMGAAIEQFQSAGLENDRERCVRQNLVILAQGFPLFQDQSELFDAMRTWVRFRVELLNSELSRDDRQPMTRASPFHRAVLARHKWWFSLLRTRQAGLKLKCDTLLDALNTNLAERVLLWTASVICETSRGGIRVRSLLEIIGGEESDRALHLSLLEVKGRLRQSGLFLMIPDGEVPGSIETWWVRPHPEVQDYLLSGKSLSDAWQGVFTAQDHDSLDVCELWRKALHNVGVVPPVGMEMEAKKLPTDLQIVQKVCEQLSVEIWTQGQPGKPLPLTQLRSALEKYC